LYSSAEISPANVINAMHVVSVVISLTVVSKNFRGSVTEVGPISASLASPDAKLDSW
jgi:hypothetical protein